MTVLAIDQGTSGTKAIVVDPEAGVCGLAEVPVHPRYLDGGGVEQDPTELLESVLAAGRAAVASAGRPIDVVSLANQGERGVPGQPRGDCLGVESGHRPAADTGDRLAGPPRGAAVCGTVRARAAVRGRDRT